MPPHHHRLENALARAEELIAVGQNAAALQLLHDALMAKWFQHNMMALEPIMLKFIDLCVELRRGRTAKDGLHQYRSLCQNTSIQGMETVIIELLQRSENKLDEAQARAEKLAVDQHDDMELENMSETMFWRATGVTEEAKERTDREVVTPWLRFLWEAYRVVLDICRHNAKLEGLYREIVTRAFAFCRKYQRKAEFRRLCEILRYHLNIVVKYPHQTNGVNLSNAESHQLQLDLRFAQLNLATELELWQEAFRTIEDIHGLFVLARKSSKALMVVNYYDKLCRIFLMSENFLFLAATWLKLFGIAQSPAQMKAADIDVQAVADNLLLSALSIPLLSEVNATCNLPSDELDAKTERLSYFLGLNKPPSRESLLREVRQKDVASLADPRVRSIVAAFESASAHPLSACDTMQRLFAGLQADAVYAKFVPPLYRNFVTVVVQHLSQDAKLVALETLQKYVAMPAVEAVKKDFSLETFLLQGNLTGDFNVRIDHLHGTVQFVRPCFAADATIEDAVPSVDAVSNAIRHLQGMAVSVPPVRALSESYHLKLIQAEHQQNLARKTAIERKKELLEAAQIQREREEARERALRLQQEQETEKIRLSEEASKRERLRIEHEREEIRKEEMRKREEEQNRLREEAARRLNIEKIVAVGKRLDYVERAFRKEEIPLHERVYLKQKEEDKLAFELRTQLLLENSHAKHQADMEVKGKLNSMTRDYEAFLEKIRANRLESFRRQQEELRRALDEEKEKRRAQCGEECKARRAAEEEDVQLQKTLEIEEAKSREENERKAAEQMEQAETLTKERAERQEKQGALDRVAEIQRQKMLEIEEKKRAEADALRAGASRPSEVFASRSSAPPARFGERRPDFFESRSPSLATSRSTESVARPAFPSRSNRPATPPSSAANAPGLWRRAASKAPDAPPKP